MRIKGLFRLFGVLILGVNTIKAQIQWTKGDASPPQKIYRFNPELPQDSVKSKITQILLAEGASGFIYAKVDSVKNLNAETFVYVNRGKTVYFKPILPLPDSLSQIILPKLQNKPPAIGANLLLDELGLLGFWLAKVEMGRFKVSMDTLFMDYKIDLGGVLPFDGLRWKGAVKTQPQFAESWLKLKRGKPFTTSLSQLQRRLQESGLFKSVGTPKLQVIGNEKIQVEIPVTEDVPGTFDLILGYLPPNGNVKGSLTGNGQIQLRNIAGKGYRFGVKLNRNPGAVSDFQTDVGASLIFGLPFGFKFQFKGHQRDSTFNQYGFLGEGAYRLGDRLEINLSINQTLTRPVARSGQNLERSAVWFGGGGLRYAQLTNRSSPTRGISLDIQVEQGRSQRKNSTALQQKIQFTGRGFWSPARRQVLALGADLDGLFSPDYQVSDLHTFGGASSMRGYNEGRFTAHVTARLFAEYRYQLDAESHAFLFFDEGYYQKPTLASVLAEKGLLSGFGIGLQYGTALGIMQVVYALNNEEGIDKGKIHFGLSLGL